MEYLEAGVDQLVVFIMPFYMFHGQTRFRASGNSKRWASVTILRDRVSIGIVMNRFLVAQVGPRRRYAVAAGLERAGMLDGLYTDLCADLNPGRAICSLGGALKTQAIHRLRGRRVPPSVVGTTRSFGWPAVRYELDKRLAGADPHRQARALSSFGGRLGRAMARAGFGKATHLYTLLGDVTPLLEAARSRRLVTVTEIYVILTAELIVARERRRYPGFETDPPADLLAEAFEWLRRVIALSDWLVVPSEAVKDDLVQNFGVESERCLLVPYAADDRWFEVRNQGVPGRLLFVGTAGLRKGIHTLGQAAQILGQDPFHYRIAGGVDEAVREHPLTRPLTFLGRIPRLDVVREYEGADVFVLPSLAEGSAEVTYEALAAGIPVVTTAEAGSVVRDGIEGFIVPASDPDALAMRVRQIVDNRDLRERMGAAARARASEFTWIRYSERLAEALSKLPATASQVSD
ncbi:MULTISPECIES: glycosyltransferase family 4 protein [unclassified Thiocapsa]|uniref:glycosyltransferase family 4 protein n=1 Tax=unclassified Thiocapsa TaxID=2641286 RepID=UPI0035AE03E3